MSDNNSVSSNAQRRLSTQYEIARVLADATDLRDATQKLFKTICNLEGFVAASLWKVSADSEFLQNVDIWTDDNPALVHFIAASLTLRIAPDTGLASFVTFLVVVGPHCPVPSAQLSSLR